MADAVWPKRLRAHETYHIAFAVEAGQRHVLEIAATSDAPDVQAGLVQITFLDAADAIIAPPYTGMLRSAKIPAYLYLSTAKSSSRVNFTAPAGAASIALAVRPWKAVALALHKVPVLFGTDGRVMPEQPVSRGRVGHNNVIQNLARAGRNAMRAAWNKARQRSASASFSCAGSELYRLSASLRVSGPAKKNDATFSLSFTGADGAPLQVRVPGFSHSESIGLYQYLRSGEPGEVLDLRAIFRAPSNARSGIATLTPSSAAFRVTRPLIVEPVTWEELRQTKDIAGASYSEARSLFIEARLRGDHEITLASSRRLDRFDGTESSARLVRQFEGIVEELALDWLPSILRQRERADPVGGDWRVAHLFKGIWPDESNGGAIRSWNIARYQARLGWSPLACLPVRGGGVRDGITVKTHDGVAVARMQFHAYSRNTIAPSRMLDLEATLQAELAEKHRCNLVHAASGFKGFDSALKGLAIARYLDVPFVYEVRSFHEQSWARPEQDVVSAPLTLARMRQEERCMAAADAVVTISQAMVEELVRRGISREKVFLVPNSIDESFLDISVSTEVDVLREQYLFAGCKVIGSISNVSAREGHDDLIAAFAKLCVARGDVRCLLVGAGNQIDALREQVRKLGLEGRLIFAGEIAHDDIRKFYQLVDVFVVPRKADYASNFVTPMKALEALAQARPLVISDLPVARELVGNEERGLLFRTGDVDDLACRIAQLLDDPLLAARLGQAGRDWASKRVWGQTITLYEAIYAYAREAFAHGKSSQV